MFYHKDMTVLDYKLLDIFCTIPYDNFLHMCVFHNSAFLDMSINMDDLLVLMNVYEDSIKCYNYVVHKIFFVYIHCHISKFICGYELYNIIFFLMLTHINNLGLQ